MSETIFIPLNKLKKSPDNARKEKHTQAHIEALAASIHAKTMLQNLVVKPERDEGGGETGFYLVTIGEGRRLAQLHRVKLKQIDKNEPIRCMLDDEQHALEISLDENVNRSNMNAMDEAEGFAGLVADGFSIEDIARRYGRTTRFVDQYLALARLPTKIRTAYRKREITLDVARAFCITDDPKAQERVFKLMSKPITHAPSVRRALTEGRVPITDKLAKFVGVETYRDAGGRITTDLYEEGVVFLDDPDVLQQLATDRADKLRETIEVEGWGWTEVQLTHARLDGMAAERLHATRRKQTPKEKKEIEALQAQIKKINGKLQHADQDNPLWEDREAAEARLAALNEAAIVWDRKLKPHAGALITIDWDGRPQITRGLIKRADMRVIAKARDTTKKKPEANAADTEAANGHDAEAQGPRLSQALMRRITEARTRGLRAALAQNAHVALALTVHVLLLRSLSQMSVSGVGLKSTPVGFNDDDGFEQARTSFAERTPEDAAVMFAACLEQPTETLLDSLATLLAETIDFTNGGQWGEEKQVQRMSDALAAALDLDMTRHWEASQDFFEQAPKGIALAALETAPSVTKLGEEERAGMMSAFAKMKKGELARTAAQAVRGAGWLPEPLITPTREGAFAVTEQGQGALADAA